MLAHETYKFEFGKYKGKTLQTVNDNDPGYLSWCMNNKQLMTQKQKLCQAIKSFLESEEEVRDKISETVDNFNTADIGSLEIKEYEVGKLVPLDNKIVKTYLMNNVGITEMGISALDKFFEGKNLNESLGEYAKQFFSNASYTKEFKKTQPELYHELVKISAFILYGILPDNFRVTTYEAGNIQAHFSNLFNLGFSIDAIIEEFSRKKTVEEKSKNTILPRKYYKKNPFLFTPVMSSMLMLGLSKDDIRRIYKCKFDNIMNSLETQTSEIEISTRTSSLEICSKLCLREISSLFKFDFWGLYTKFVTNPYAFYKVSLSTCDTVLFNSGRSPNQMSLEKILGKVSRLVYDKVVDMKWSAVPLWLVRQNFTDVLNFKEKLEMDYGMFFEDNNVYLKHVYDEETTVAEYIHNVSLDFADSQEIDKLFNNKLTDEQITAVIESLSNKITIITGSAGTGKTSTIKELIQQIDAVKSGYIICSYTAKAVKRVIEVVGSENAENVKTIHSLLNSDIFDCKTHPKYLIIDETSMVDLSLLSRLINLIKNKNVYLLMLGDVNQLPPIKYGRPFEDILESKAVITNKLTKNMRVVGGESDPIIVNSNNIVFTNNYQVSPGLNFKVITSSNFDFKDLVKQYGISIKNIDKHKFITARNSDNILLNDALSKIINPRSSYRKISITFFDNSDKRTVDIKFSVGDPVIFTKNRIYPGVSNGCEGIIYSVDDRRIVVKSQSGLKIEVPIFQIRNNIYTLRHMMLAYSISVHRSQGSQWDNVYYYVSGTASKKFLNKRMSYTAITRASNNCVVIETTEGLFEKTCNTPIALCYSGITDKLHKFQNNMTDLPDF